MHRVSAPADDLSDSLRSINVRSVVFCRSEFTAPWGFRVEDTTIAKFHLVLRGQAHLVLDGDDQMHQLVRGDVVILPHGTGHALTDAPDSPAPSLEGILLDQPVDEAGSMSYGGGGAVTTVVCGGFGTDALPTELIEQLPRVLVLASSDRGVSRWLDPLAARRRASRLARGQRRPGEGRGRFPHRVPPSVPRLASPVAAAGESARRRHADRDSAAPDAGHAGPSVDACAARQSRRPVPYIACRTLPRRGR